jgi:hypothetical protein
VYFVSLLAQAVIISLKQYYPVDLCDVSGSHSGDYEDDSRLGQRYVTSLK